MTRPRPQIAARTRFYVGCEGESEQGYVALLQALADDAGLRVHLKGDLLSGGAPLARVQSAQFRIHKEEVGKGRFKARYLLLDSDQRTLNPGGAQEAIRLAERIGVSLIWQTPCHEAVLLRHFDGFQTHRPQTTDQSIAELQRHWPGYRKAMTAIELRRKLDLAGVRRAGAVEPELAALLRMAGLMPQP